MKYIVKQPIALVCLLAWIGFVCAISFMEAWLKFQAPGVTLSIGLGIGRIVFAALNKVEWVFAIFIVISTVVHKTKFFTVQNHFLCLATFLLCLQTWWLLPALDARANLYINNRPVPPSNLHISFIAAEALKVASLFITAITHFKRFEKPRNNCNKFYKAPEL